MKNIEDNAVASIYILNIKLVLDWFSYVYKTDVIKLRCGKL